MLAAAEIENLPVRLEYLRQGHGHNQIGGFEHHHVVLKHQYRFETVMLGVLDNLSMRQSAADVMMLRRVNGREFLHLVGEAEFLKPVLRPLPAVGVMVQTDAENFREDVIGGFLLLFQTLDHIIHHLLVQMLGEMINDRLLVQPHLLKADQVVADAVLPFEAVLRAMRAAETVGPWNERRAQTAPAIVANFLVDIALFAAEAAETLVEAGPCGLAADEHAKPLHLDFKRRVVFV